MINKYILCVSLLMFPIVLFSQGSIKGKVSERGTNKAIPCSEITLFNNNHKFITYSNQDGEYSFQEVPVGIYNLKSNHKDYIPYQEKFTIRADSTILNNITMDSVVYNDGHSDSVEVNDWFSYTFGVNFHYFAPDNYLFKQNLSIQPFNLEFRRLLVDQMQWGLLFIPLELSFHDFKKPEASPAIKPSLLDEFNDEKNYRSASAGLTFYIRRILTENSFGSAFYYIDMGLGYKIPYSYKLNYLNDAKSKITKQGIHKFNQFEFMMRLGVDIYTIKANIRLTDYLRYKQIPRYSLGLEVSLPRN